MLALSTKRTVKCILTVTTAIFATHFAHTRTPWSPLCALLYILSSHHVRPDLSLPNLMELLRNNPKISPICLLSMPVHEKCQNLISSTLSDHNPVTSINRCFITLICDRIGAFVFIYSANMILIHHENLVFGAWHRPFRQYFINQPEFNRLFWVHKMVAIKGFLNNIIRLARMMLINFI